MRQNRKISDDSGPTLIDEVIAVARKARTEQAAMSTLTERFGLPEEVAQTLLTQARERDSHNLARRALQWIDERGGIDAVIQENGKEVILKYKVGEDLDRGAFGHLVRHHRGEEVLLTYSLGELSEVIKRCAKEGRDPLADEIYKPKPKPPEKLPRASDAPDLGDLLDLFEEFAPAPFASEPSKSTSSRKKLTTKRAKGYAEWNPHKKTRLILAQVNEIFAEYRDYLPLTARQVFYRLVGAYGYPKDEKAYERLTGYLVRARRAGLIPFEYLRDDGASVMSHRDHYESEEDFHAATRERGERFRLNRLADQNVSMRVYCEAAGMMPQLHDTLEEFSIPVFSCSGFDSLTAKWDLKEWCHDTLVYEGKTPVVLHLGDYDPSGESIFNDGLVEDIHAFLEVDAPSAFKSVGEQFPFQRAALTREQIEKRVREGRPLPSAPPKATDSRSKRWRGGDTYQLEALPPDELAQELRLAVIPWLDRDTLKERIEAEPAVKRNIMRAIPAPNSSPEEEEN